MKLCTPALVYIILILIVYFIDYFILKSKFRTDFIHLLTTLIELIIFPILLNYLCSNNYYNVAIVLCAITIIISFTSLYLIKNNLLNRELL
jgi:hypothetical protein